MNDTGQSAIQTKSNLALEHLPLIYTILEGIVAVGAFFGNFLVILVFILDKRLRKVTNFYIISLAVADLFVGLVGVPSAILTRMGLPHNSFRTCLTMLSLLVVLCTISILNLVAVSLDRYWAILHPLDYHRRISGQTAMLIIFSCWIIGAVIGFLPLFGWNNGPVDVEGKCLFIKVINYDFLVFLYFSTIVLPALIMAFFYLRIYLVVIKQLRQISTLEEVPSGHFKLPINKRNRYHKRKSLSQLYYKSHNFDSDSVSDLPKSKSLMTPRKNRRHSVIKPMKINYNRKEIKKAQKLFIIVVFFMMCWIPLYTHNTIQAFCLDCRPASEILVDILIILSHLNSVGSPFLYAFHMKDFREALKRLLCQCVLQPRHLRDLRRQELLNLHRRRIVNINDLYATSTNVTPEISPNQSLDYIAHRKAICDFNSYSVR